MKRLSALTVAATLVMSPALADTCALDDPSFTPPPNDSSNPAADVDWSR
ncbi:MAG: hypothetical protein HKN14_10530 [Marinicaulis sp.]|nr:hypothetical protein [Marinicaulis sp.]NNE41338.1 hypothetical protein [Marinicaulis sp.]